MKKRLSLYNIIITMACILLSVLLYHAYQESQQSPIAADTVTTPLATPSTSPIKALPVQATVEPWMMEESYYLPFGELPLPVLQQYAEYHAVRPHHSLREENPIDAAFEPYWDVTTATSEENGLAGHYAECWQAEALHALALLEQRANPSETYIPQLIQQIKSSLEDFANISGELYATVFRTDIFLYEGLMPGDTVNIGTAFPGAMTASGAAILRSYTFYLYDLLASMNIQPNFVFDPQPVHAQWDYLLE